MQASFFWGIFYKHDRHLLLKYTVKFQSQMNFKLHDSCWVATIYFSGTKQTVLLKYIANEVFLLGDQVSL